MTKHTFLAFSNTSKKVLPVLEIKMTRFAISAQKRINGCQTLNT